MRSRARFVVLVAVTVLLAAGCRVAAWNDPGGTLTGSTPLTLVMDAGRSDGIEAPATGEGVLAVTMSAPGTAWDSANTAVVVEASVDDGPAQQIVLFDGAQRHTYKGFTGPLSTGNHKVVIAVRNDLSSVSGGFTPTVLMNRVELSVVPSTDPSYAAIAHAPVLYGRGISAHSDTPLMRYARTTPLGGGASRIEYTEFWSNEDAGTGAAPVLLWGGYGRTTDIETSVRLDLDSTGAVTGGEYQTCAACPLDWPENQSGTDHSYVPFAGQYFGGHPIVRVATGNNVLKDAGTTAFRFQQVPGAPPAAGEVRESAMDPLPDLTKVMSDEMHRERTALGDYSEDPLNAGAGDARQYAIIDIDTSPSGTKAVGVDLQFVGDATTYKNDGGTNLTLFYTGGHRRTAVKVPLDWHGRTLSLMRLRLVKATPTSTPTITVNRVQILEIGTDFSVSQRPTPTIETTIVG